eukprot:6010724-Pleurochrysis_carterae.AAC.1
MRQQSARATVSANSVHRASARRDVRCSMRAPGARCVACERTLRMRKQIARATLRANSVHGASARHD